MTVMKEDIFYAHRSLETRGTQGHMEKQLDQSGGGEVRKTCGGLQCGFVGEKMGEKGKQASHWLV